MTAARPLRASTLCAVVMALFAAGCAAERPLDGPDPRVERYVSHGWLVGDSSAAVQSKLGSPATLVTTPTANRHRPSQKDDYVELRYPGIEMVFYRVNEKPPRELPVRVAVTDEKIETMYGLRVGSSKRRVERALGESFTEIGAADLAQYDRRITSDCDESPCAYLYSNGPSEACFIFKDDRVSRIDWFLYVD